MERVGGGVLGTLDPRYRKWLKPNPQTTFTQPAPPTPPGDYAPEPPGQVDQPPPGPKSIDQILAEDPIFQAQLARFRADATANNLNRNQSIQRALIDFGFLPEQLKSWLGLSGIAQQELDKILDPTTQALIKKNTDSGMSLWARMAAAAKIQQRDVMNSVGARGAFRSGETSYGLRQTNLAADQARYDSIKSVTDYLAGVQQAFTTAERARLDAEDAARRAAISGYVEPPPAVDTGVDGGTDTGIDTGVDTGAGGAKPPTAPTAAIPKPPPLTKGGPTAITSTVPRLIVPRQTWLKKRAKAGRM